MVMTALTDIDKVLVSTQHPEDTKQDKGKRTCIRCCA